MVKKSHHSLHQSALITINAAADVTGYNGYEVNEAG